MNPKLSCKSTNPYYLQLLSSKALGIIFYKFVTKPTLDCGRLFIVYLISVIFVCFTTEILFDDVLLTQTLLGQLRPYQEEKFPNYSEGFQIRDCRPFIYSASESNLISTHHPTHPLTAGMHKVPCELPFRKPAQGCSVQ